MKQKTANILFVGLIIAVILFMIWTVVWIKTETTNCVINPVNYFQEKNPDIDCTCYKDGVIVKGLGNDDPFNISVRR